MAKPKNCKNAVGSGGEGRGEDLRKAQIKDNFCFKDYFELQQVLKSMDDPKFVSLRMVTHQDTGHKTPMQSPPARQAKHN